MKSYLTWVIQMCYKTIKFKSRNDKLKTFSGVENRIQYDLDLPKTKNIQFVNKSFSTEYNWKVSIYFNRERTFED